ncbi:hypothetical protein [Photobacterium leiognathi]|uniref:hypothetical protein n=1 Tax=Photobacterium leiognathi TaxID=553611 RepID=UPI0027356402|nr:hypothetical protein [Photobacterium leiognathi]
MKDIRLAFLYSTLKYVEMFILAIVNILLARKIGPAEMGYGMSFLLFVTYSNYFNLGGPQVYLKMKAIGNRVDYNIISKNIILALLFSLFIPLILFDNIDDSIFIGLVSITVLLRSYYLSRCRLKENLKAINIINIFGSFSLLLLFFLFVNNFTDYIKMWFVSNLLVLIIYVFYEVEFTRKLINGVFFKVNFDDLMFFYGVGIKLSLIGLVTTLFLSMDRLMISMLDNDQKTLGVYQLSDTMSMLFYVFITNVQFYFTQS